MPKIRYRVGKAKNQNSMKHYYLSLLLALVASTGILFASSFTGFEVVDENLGNQIYNKNLIQNMNNIFLEETDSELHRYSINLIEGGEGSFTMGGVSFSYTNSQAGKTAYKTYVTYIQPNGVDRTIRIPACIGEKVNIRLVEACNDILVNGESMDLGAGDNIITAHRGNIVLQNPTTKPKISAIIPVSSSTTLNATVTLDYSAKGYENQTNLNNVSISEGNVSVTLTKGTGSVEPKYYDAGTGARTYGGNVINISASSGIISKIVFSFTQNSKNYSVNTGTYSQDDATWTGSSSNVVFTTESGSGHNRIKAITITYSYEVNSSNCYHLGDVNVSTIHQIQVAQVLYEFCYPQEENQANYNYLFLPGDIDIVAGYTICGLEQLSQTWSGNYNHQFKCYLVPSSRYSEIEYVCSNQEYYIGDQIDGKTIIGRSVKFYKGFTPSASSTGRQYDELFFFKEGGEVVHVTSSLRNSVSDIYPHYDEFRPSDAYDYMYAVLNLEPDFINIAAKMPSDWGNTISAWVWEDGSEGHWATLEKNGEWYTYSSAISPLNIVFVNGTTWNGNNNQSVDISITENTCIQLADNDSGKRTYTIVDCDPEPNDIVHLPYYEPFTSDIGKFNIVNVDLGGIDYVWQWASANYGMKASAYVNGTNNATESWLLSPSISLENVTNATLAFEHAVNKGSTSNLKVMITTDPNGETWDNLVIPNWPAGTNWTFVPTSVSLNQHIGEIVQLAFVYVSTSSDCPTWEIKNLSITSSEVTTDLPSISAETNRATKIVKDGYFLILRDNKTYTVTGQEIQ